MASLEGSVIYRYFFFSWLFKDASKGNVFEQAAAVRWNKANAHWLFTYLRRWAFLMVLFYCLGILFEAVLRLPVVSAFFYVPSVISITINSVISVMIAWLKLVP